MGSLVVVLLALTQVGAALHFLLVPHALGPGAQVLVHCDRLPAPGPSNGPAPAGSREACQIFPILCQNTNVSAPSPVIGEPSIAVHAWAPAPTGSDLVRTWPIFMLAPAHSPPDLAA